MLDRNTRLLTGGAGAMMVRQPPPPAARDSIFGDTYLGVPSPNVFLQHGYPTRYHGPEFTWPVAGHTYVPATYARAPFAGFGADILGYQTRSLSGSQVIDAIIGGAIGYFTAPGGKQREMHALIGAGLVGYLGFIGGVLLGGLEVYLRSDDAKDRFPSLAKGATQ